LPKDGLEVLDYVLQGCSMVTQVFVVFVLMESEVLCAWLLCSCVGFELKFFSLLSDVFSLFLFLFLWVLVLYFMGTSNGNG